MDPTPSFRYIYLSYTTKPNNIFPVRQYNKMPPRGRFSYFTPKHAASPSPLRLTIGFWSMSNAPSFPTSTTPSDPGAFVPARVEAALASCSSFLFRSSCSAWIVGTVGRADGWNGWKSKVHKSNLFFHLTAGINYEIVLALFRRRTGSRVTAEAEEASCSSFLSQSPCSVRIVGTRESAEIPRVSLVG